MDAKNYKELREQRKKSGSHVTDAYNYVVGGCNNLINDFKNKNLFKSDELIYEEARKMNLDNTIIIYGANYNCETIEFEMI